MTKKQQTNRIKCLEEHTIGNSKVILALFCVILFVGLVVSIGFYDTNKKLNKISSGEWECVEHPRYIYQCDDEVIIKLNHLFEEGIKWGEIINKTTNSSIECYYQLSDECTKFQFVKHGDS